MNIETDKQNLQGYYQHLASEARTNAFRIIAQIRSLVFWYAKIPYYFSLGNFVLSSLSCVLISEHRLEISFSFIVSIAQLFLVRGVYLHFLSIHKIIDDRLKDSPSHRLRDISKSVDPDDIGLARSITQFAQKMQIGPNEIRIMLDLECFAFFPSIKHYEERDCLIIPIGWVILQNTKPAHAYALLAHELGHVCQQDSTLLIVAEIIAGKLYQHMRTRIVFTISWMLSSAILLIIFQMHLFFGRGNLAPPIENEIISRCKDMVPIFFNIGFYVYLWRKTISVSQEVLSARMQSEHIADLAGLAFAEGDAIKIVINDYISDMSTSLHPSREERSRYLSGYRTNR